MALTAYEQALHLGEDANIHVYIGLIHLNRGDLEHALHEFQKAVELDPQNALAFRALGDAAWQNGDMADALQAYQKSLALDDSPQLRSQIASVYSRQGKPDLAIREAEIARQGDPQNPLILSQLAGLYSQIGQLDMAIEQYHRILELEPDRPDAHAGLGMVAYKRCELAMMSQEFESASRQGSGQVYYRVLPALAYGALGQAEQQSQGYFTLLQDFPDDPLAHLLYGEFAIQITDSNLAESEFHKVLQSDKSLPALLSLAHVDLGLLRYAERNLAEAEQEFRMALQASPANAAAQAALGDTAMRQNDPETALQAYELALSVLPEYGYTFSTDNATILEPALQARRGLALQRLNRASEAEQAFQQALALTQTNLERTPDWPQARLGSAIVFYLLGDENQADAEFGRALMCDASLQTAIERLKSDLAHLR
jgi:tetratricopeptide (TPR) repeat protein